MASERNKSREFLLELIEKIDLPQTYKFVLSQRIRDESLEFIARDLAMSRQRVSQIEEKAIVKLNTYLLTH
jgi:DNA-directed RNA polymerase sigma subunit (sigma70/sigma32)